MDTRISDLSALNPGSFDPTTSWLECIVVDLSSPTGFTTVRVKASSVGGAAVGLNEIAFGDSTSGAITSDSTFTRNPSTGNISIGHNLNNGKLDIKGANSSAGTNALHVQNQSTTTIFKVENNGSVYLDALRPIAGSVINAYGVQFTFPSGGGVYSANMVNCFANQSDFSFGNNFGIYGAGRVSLGDNSQISTSGGYVSNYFRITPLGGNYGQALDRFIPSSDGAYIFVQRYTPSLNRITMVTPDDKMQVFGDAGWEMPIGGALKTQFNANDLINFGPTYDQSDASTLANQVQETRLILAALIRHLGNQTFPADFTSGTNMVTSTALALPGRHRVRFISGPIPASITYNQWYYVEDAGQSGTDFQISASYGGSPIAFATSDSGATMEVEFSGMNILKS